MEYKKLLLEPLHRTEAISMTLQEILSENNLNTALEHLNKKKGIPGIDKMSMDAFSEYWHKNKNIIKQKLENGTYKPRPVMACYIAKPGKKEKRKLEIPCMTDRLILYAMQLALSPHYEPLFSESSYGFRKGRNCLDAIDSCLMHINNGMQVIVDLDIRKFFDTVNHKLLFELLEKEIKDNKLLSLIQRYVKIKVVEKGKKNDKKTMGISQGSALSPLMANIYLDVLDKYLEKQEIPFVRYADDMVIFCNTKTEAQNILTDVTSFIQNNLQLTLNSEKTNICLPSELNFLGYGFTLKQDGTYTPSVSKKSQNNVFMRIDKILHNKSLSVEQRFVLLGAFNRGWSNYYKNIDLDIMHSFFNDVKQYINTQINLLISEEPQKRKEYATILYNCKNYSSMHGWLQKIKNGNYNLNCSGGEYMSSKYNHWRSGFFYKSKNFFNRQLTEIIQEPFFCTENCSVFLSNYKFDKTTPNKIDHSLCLAVLGILAAGKGMLFSQLYLYLHLLDFSISQEKLSNIMCYLGYMGVLQAEVLCHNNHNNNPKCIDDRHVAFYHITAKGKQYIKRIKAPLDYEPQQKLCSDSAGIIIFDTINCIISNQVVLNSLLFDPYFVYYDISKKITDNDTFFKMHLCIQNQQKNYFEYIKNVNKKTIRNAIHKLETYYKNHPGEMQFIILVDTYENMKLLKYYIEEELISKPWLYHHNIMFSSIHSWFRNQASILTPYYKAEY